MNKDENKPQGNSDWLKTFGLDLVDKVTCDGIGCDNEAFRYCKVSCCGAVMISCPKHLEDAYRVMLSLAYQGKFIVCKTCHAINKPQGWLGKPISLALET